jgi:hypothetical protein
MAISSPLFAKSNAIKDETALISCINAADFRKEILSIDNVNKNEDTENSVPAVECCRTATATANFHGYMIELSHTHCSATCAAAYIIAANVVNEAKNCLQGKCTEE